MELLIVLYYTLKTRDLAAKTNAVKEEFISNVTHVLRTPSTFIRGYLGIVNAGGMGDVPEAFKDPLKLLTVIQRLY